MAARRRQAGLRRWLIMMYGQARHITEGIDVFASYYEQYYYRNIVADAALRVVERPHLIYL